MDPFGGPVVELGQDSTPYLPSVLHYRRVPCRASCPGLRISPVTPAGLGVELVEPVAQTRTAVERQKPAVRQQTGVGLSYRGASI